MSKKISIWTALIHNNNEERNTVVQPLLKELRDFMAQKFNTGNIEISMQPEIQDHGIFSKYQYVEIKLGSNVQAFSLE